MTRREIEQKLAELDAKRVQLVDKLNNSKGRTLVECTNNMYGGGCGKKMQIRTLTHIQTWWYVHPHGCTGGDYWSMDEGQFDCAHCGHRNRLYDRKEIQDIKQHFGNHVTSHDENGHPPKIDEPG